MPESVGRAIPLSSNAFPGFKYGLEMLLASGTRVVNARMTTEAAQIPNMHQHISTHASIRLDKRPLNFPTSAGADREIILIILHTCRLC